MIQIFTFILATLPEEQTDIDIDKEIEEIVGQLNLDETVEDGAGKPS